MRERVDFILATLSTPVLGRRLAIVNPPASANDAAAARDCGLLALTSSDGDTVLAAGGVAIAAARLFTRTCTPDVKKLRARTNHMAIVQAVIHRYHVCNDQQQSKQHAIGNLARMHYRSGK